LVLDRGHGTIRHAIFRQIGRFLTPGDLLVINQTQVIPARLYARKLPTGGKIEILLLRRRSPQIWEVLVGGKGLSPGKRVKVDSGPEAFIQEDLGGSRRLLRFEKPVSSFLPQAGHVPLPPYIHEPLSRLEHYQTVYATQPGSAAAPTAGLHFTRNLMEELAGMGVGFATVTLHIGLDTFAPVTEQDPADHKIHTEWCQVSSETAAQINHTHQAGGRIIAVGTTSVRALESAAGKAPQEHFIQPFEGPTDLFILPGYQFRIIDAMITNFHLPKSTLLMLVSAFADREKILETYRIAIKEDYRFYSFGDAMLII
jgi:S-adenosylmethionine:tRNA ribosyltransferase-isomerase